MSFFTSGIWKKNDGIAEAIESVTKVLRKAEREILIYSSDLLDEIYYAEKVVEAIKNRVQTCKIKIVYNNKVDKNKSIMLFLEKLKKDGGDVEIIQTPYDELTLDFIISDNKYIRVEFDRVNHKARYLDEVEKPEEKEEAERLIALLRSIEATHLSCSKEIPK
jgi:hypothetical protein